jgi:peroxiredoxin
MKKLGVLFSMVLAFSLVSTKVDDAVSLKAGDKAPKADLKMKSTSGGEYSLNDLKKESGIIVIFTACNCPFVVGSEDNEGWEGRYNGVLEHASQNNVEVVLVNSNASRRDGSDSFEKMQEKAKSGGYKMKLLVDNDSELADAFGAKTTPHVFFFGKDMELVYSGAIDDNVKDSKDIKSKYIKEAIEQYASGKKVKVSSTKPVGCSIKRN